MSVVGKALARNNGNDNVATNLFPTSFSTKNASSSPLEA